MYKTKYYTLLLEKKIPDPCNKNHNKKKNVWINIASLYCACFTWTWIYVSCVIILDNSSLYCLFQTLVQYKTQLADDPIVNAHLKTLYDNLLEQNLCRIIEPFSRVQVYWEISVES